MGKRPAGSAWRLGVFIIVAAFAALLAASVIPEAPVRAAPATKPPSHDRWVGLIKNPSSAPAPAVTSHVVATYYVGKTGDTTGASDCTNSGNTDCSLRDAVAAANANAGTSTINIPPGTYTLTAGELDLGTADNQTITLAGTNAATTTIQQDNRDIVFVADYAHTGQTFNFQNLTITGGRADNATTTGAGGFGGGAIQEGANNQHVSITNCVFTGNTNVTQGGGAIQYSGGTLTIDGSTFSGNTSASTSSAATGGSSIGGAIDIYDGLFGGTLAVNITNTTFTSNTAGSAASVSQAQGGAISLESNSIPVTITGSMFTNNRAIDDTGGVGQGGALFNDNGTFIAHYNRFAGNTATQGAAFFQTTNAGTDTIDENWWGTNNPATVISGTTTYTPFLQLTQTASPQTIELHGPNSSTTLTASFLKDSAGNAVSVSNIGVLIDLPVTWNNAVKGTLSNTQNTIQSSGTATATFTASAVGSGTADAKVDNGTATTSPAVTIEQIVDHFTVTAPANATAGTPFNVTVTALDASNFTVTGYTGTVTFTSTDAQATSGSGLPANYTFVSGDSGTHTFTNGVTLKTAGNQTITATDTDTNTITGASNTIAVTPGATTALALSGYPSPTTAGASHSFTVTVKDGSGNTMTSYTGTVHFISSDPHALLPPDYPFQASDSGTHTFTAAFRTAGTHSLTATDTTTTSITGSQTGITVTGGAGAAFLLTAPPNAPVGSNFTVTLTVQDAFGNRATGYTGTLHFTSSDGQATLPADYTFTSADIGTHQFTGVSLRTTGSQQLIATDTQASSITGRVTVTVGTNPKPHNGSNPGVFRPTDGTVLLRNENNTGIADLAFFYGIAGDQPLVGDWTGSEGKQTVGIYRNGAFSLRTSNATGPADIAPFAITGLPGGSQSGDKAVAGDWDGDGTTTVGIFRNGVFYLRNRNSTGPADVVVYFGAAGDVPLVGDWTGKGYTSVGVYRVSSGGTSTFFLRNSNTSGGADTTVVYGVSGDVPVVGDWDGNGTTTVGIVRGNEFFVRNANTEGYADLTLYFGASGDVPLAGDWDGNPTPGIAPR